MPTQIVAKTTGAMLALLAIAGTGMPRVAQAHPHVWIDVSNELMFDGDRLTGLRTHWAFDDLYSAFAVQGLDTDGDGTWSPEELQALTDENMKNLADWNWFTDTRVDSRLVDYTGARDAISRFEDERLTMSFSLDLADPPDVRRQPVEIVSYDPTFYIAMETKAGDVSLTGAPPDCAVRIEPPQKTGAVLADSVAQIEEDLARSFALDSASAVKVACGTS